MNSWVSLVLGSGFSLLFSASLLPKNLRSASFFVMFLLRAGVLSTHENYPNLNF